MDPDTATRPTASREELSPLPFLRRAAFLWPGRTAVVDHARQLSYADLRERVAHLAGALRWAGVDHQDRVAYLCPNTLAMIEAHFAVPAAGGVLVPLNIRLTPGEIAYILDHSGAKVLVVDRELRPLVQQIDTAGITVVQVDDTGADDDPYERFVTKGPTHPLDVHPLHEDDLISLNYTSGTTGRPKGVMYTHRGACLQVLGTIIEAGLDTDTVHLWTLPLFHCNGWTFPWAVAAVGGTQVTLRKADPARIWQLITDRGVTRFDAAPTVHLSIVEHPAAGPLPHPVTVGMGGSPPSPALVARLRALGFQPVHLYGLTETYSAATVNRLPPTASRWPAEQQAEVLARQGQGLLTQGIVRVVDEQLQDVPADGSTVGEVVMRGNTVTAGYFRQPDATATAFRGGWFHSGDLAVWHPDRSIQLRDRKKDIIVSGGENIATIEVETALSHHPDVQEVAVVAMPHPTWGERPKAFVTARPGARLDEEEVIAFCRQRLAHFKCPDAVEVVDALPKTATGKIQKFLLREQEWAGHGSRIG